MHAGQASISFANTSIFTVAMPMFTERFEDVYIRPGSMASLTCSVSGNPTPLIHWTLDDGPLPTDVRTRRADVTMPNGDVMSSINITHVRVEDGGAYRCTASNQIGELSHVGRLNVYGKHVQNFLRFLCHCMWIYANDQGSVLCSVK